jgi:hypothetical protein
MMYFFHLEDGACIRDPTGEEFFRARLIRQKIWRGDGIFTDIRYLEATLRVAGVRWQPVISR